MTFPSFILYVLVFMAVGFSAGGLWFLFCRWDTLFNCRNYKSLAVVIPGTFLLVFVVSVVIARTETKASTPIPPPVLQKKETKKPAKAPKLKRPVKKDGVVVPSSEAVPRKNGGIEIVRPRPEAGEENP